MVRASSSRDPSIHDASQGSRGPGAGLLAGSPLDLPNGRDRHPHHPDPPRETFVATPPDARRWGIIGLALMTMDRLPKKSRKGPGMLGTQRMRL